MYIQSKVEEAQKLINYLEENGELDIDKQLEILGKIQEIIGENPSLVKYQCICLYNAGFINEAKEYLADMIKKYQQSYELHSLMFELHRFTDDYETVFKTLAQMFKCAGTKSLQDDVLKLLEEYVTNISITNDEFEKYFSVFKEDIASVDYRAYPIDEYGKSIIRENAFPGRDKDNSYLVNMYKSEMVSDVNDDSRFYFLYEMIKGKFIEKSAGFPVRNGDVIAVSSAIKQPVETNVILYNLGDNPYKFVLPPNRIKYFKARKDSNIVIESDQNIFVSHFKNNKLIDKPKLVLQIFIDGLSYQFLKENDFEKLMPNTFRFFEKGYINENCHANGEWTLPSLMSMCTGRYTTNHYIYDTNAAHKGEVNNKLIQEYFYEAGYMTGRICSNWRGTPSYGYFKGTNRSVYSPLFDRMSCSESVTEALEHLEAFKDFYNYTWLTIEDLHTVADGITNGPLFDINTERYLSENMENDSDISVFRSYNEKKIEEYKSTMKKIDFYLGILYRYIEDNYDEHEYVITLNSDHGQKFIVKDDYMFTHKRTNVPFMMRGRDVINLRSNELMSNVDVLPLLLHVCGLECNSKIDGKLLKDFSGDGREYTITESIFPGQTYKLAINDYDHLLTFESTEDVRPDGLIPVEDYSIKLRNRKTGEDETDKYPDKIGYYLEVIFEHIKEWIAL